MSSTGIGARVVAAVSAQTLRVVGLSMIVVSMAVAAASVSTEHGLAVGTGSGGQTSYLADVGAVTALVEFVGAHPAYGGAVLVGFVLVVAGEETPLLGS